MQHLIGCLESADFNTRKMAIDVVYTLAKIHPIVLKPYKRELNDMLNELRFDKMKPVRDACLEAFKAFKEAPDLEVTEDDRQREDTKKNKQEAKQQKLEEIKKEVVKRAPRFIAN